MCMLWGDNNNPRKSQAWLGSGQSVNTSLAQLESEILDLAQAL